MRHANEPCLAGPRRPTTGHFIRSDGSPLTWEHAHDVALLVKGHDNQHSSNLRSKIAGRLMGMLDAPSHAAALNEARSIRRKLDAIDKRRQARIAA